MKKTLEAYPMASDRYPLARDGVYATVQGEGALLGEPMVFIRLAGCSVGCPLCDTDYRVAERATAAEIADRVRALSGDRGRVWITGGEPTDHDLWPLLTTLDGGPYGIGWWVGLATSGHRPVEDRWNKRIDWLSISPHDHARWRQRRGDELKVVPGLGAARLDDFAADPDVLRFAHKFAQPLDGRPESVAECAAFVRAHPDWRLGVQAHRFGWGMP